VTAAEVVRAWDDEGKAIDRVASATRSLREQVARLASLVSEEGEGTPCPLASPQRVAGGLPVEAK